MTMIIHCSISFTVIYPRGHDFALDYTLYFAKDNVNISSGNLLYIVTAAYHIIIIIPKCPNHKHFSTPVSKHISLNASGWGVRYFMICDLCNAFFPTCFMPEGQYVKERKRYWRNVLSKFQIEFHQREMANHIDNLQSEQLITTEFTAKN